MPDLQDGESSHLQGSAVQPYVLKNVGGVYSCSCPAWRNQSLPIDRRTCKHLRALRGAAAEQARVGGPLSSQPLEASKPVPAPPLLLAESWDSALDPTAWWLSEKLDGVRAYWTGAVFLSRQGNRFHAPTWFTAGLPKVPLDGELWLDRKQFQRAVSIVRRQDQSDHWKEITFLVFDAPKLQEPFERRVSYLTELIREHRPPYASPHVHTRCQGQDHLREELIRIEALGGEGLMLRQPGSLYESGRSRTLLKVKTFHDAEARVIEHQTGRGRHKNRLGALRVELPDGTTFAVGTGFTDAQRENPPPIGSSITFRYQELTDAGVPRFPSYVGIRGDFVIAPEKGDRTMQSKLRRFEFTGGTSFKFWEVQVNDTVVIVRFGRIGTAGQKQFKTFQDEAAANKYADKLVREKTAKGYREAA